jgi:hypothetical protein
MKGAVSPVSALTVWMRCQSPPKGYGVVPLRFADFLRRGDERPLRTANAVELMRQRVNHGMHELGFPGV